MIASVAADVSGLQIEKDGESEPIVCQMILHGGSNKARIQRMQIPHQYLCLSHVWGTVKTLDLAGISVQVSSSAKVATIEKLLARHADQPLWADIVAINKDTNPVEKSRMIVKMNRIYSGASKVCIISDRHHIEHFLRLTGLFQSFVLRAGETSEAGEDRLHADVGTVLSELSRSAYYSRVWTVQEQLVAGELEYIDEDAESCLIVSKLIYLLVKSVILSARRPIMSQWCKRVVTAVGNARHVAVGLQILIHSQHLTRDPSGFDEFRSAAIAIVDSIMEGQEREQVETMIEQMVQRTVCGPNETIFSTHSGPIVVDNAMTLSDLASSCLRRTVRKAEKKHDLIFATAPLFGLTVEGNYETDLEALWLKYHVDLISSGSASIARFPCMSKNCHAKGWSIDLNCDECWSEGLLSKIFESPEKNQHSKCSGIANVRISSVLDALANQPYYIIGGIAAHIRAASAMNKSMDLADFGWAFTQYADFLETRQMESVADRNGFDHAALSITHAKQQGTGRSSAALILFYPVMYAVLNFCRKSHSSDLDDTYTILVNMERKLLLVCRAMKDGESTKDRRFQILDFGSRHVLVNISPEETTAKIVATFVTKMESQYADRGSPPGWYYYKEQTFPDGQGLFVEQRDLEIF
ncbi:hypothetical protein HDU82_000105 [Entophlyctis luteolus]|nr:hypothetical protein HDU82_000105 [Entophlyctis luteolus]